jgi:hypothetical protein
MGPYWMKSSGEKAGKGCLDSLHFCAVAVEICAERPTKNTKEYASKHSTDFGPAKSTRKPRRTKFWGATMTDFKQHRNRTAYLYRSSRSRLFVKVHRRIDNNYDISYWYGNALKPSGQLELQFCIPSGCFRPVLGLSLSDTALCQAGSRSC